MRHIVNTTAMAIILSLSIMNEAQADRLIGGIGLTHLTVYEQRAAPDGTHSGCPHVHGITDEAYYVLSGTGIAELHDIKQGFTKIELEPGQYLQFPPGVLHRIISTDELVILAVMGNAGLAEHGDARIYFGEEVDNDPEEFARLTGLAREKGLEGALERRDASVKAYAKLLDLWEMDREAYFKELRRFISVHAAAMNEITPRFAEAVETGPLWWGKRARQRLDNLPEIEMEIESRFHDGNPETVYGMCGILRPLLKLEPIGTPRQNP